MIKTKMFVFAANIYAEIEELSRLLTEAGIESELDWFIGKRIIVTDDTNYLKCLEEGTFLAKENKFTTINWVDARNAPLPLGYIPVMKCSLPKTEINDDMPWGCYELNDCKYCSPYIVLYLNALSAHLGYKIAVRYNGHNDEAIELLIEADFSEHEKLVENCQLFNAVQKEIPFSWVSYMKKDGTLSESEEKFSMILTTEPSE